jgi:HlyD family secretion protein
MGLKKNDIVYSEPVREIMGNPPRRILRWGTTIIFSVFVLFIIFSIIIRYPDLIPSPVEITTENPPITLVSKITGKIKHLYVSDKETVDSGKLIAVMETAASIEEIMKLRRLLDSVPVQAPGVFNIPDFSQLGELQNSFSVFSRNSYNLYSFITNDYYGSKIWSTTEEMKELRTYIGQLKENERLISENLQLDIRRFRRDSVLFLNGKTITDADYERSKQELNRQRINLQNVRLEISQKKIEEINKQQLITEYSIKKKEESEKLASAKEESLRNLMAQLQIWENTYLLISPVSGTVTFTKFWTENQIVAKDEPVVTVVPEEQGSYIGRVLLGMQRSGKVTTGQKAYLKLSSFPYLEYGMIEGRVKTKSLVSAGNAYVIEIELPDGLTTLYGKQLGFTQNMQGTAEIISDDRSLISRIFSPFRYLFSISRRK